MGTSACIMASTREPCFVPGVWGPYFSAMVPGRWLCEGGQSAAGAAIDRLVRSHPAYPQVHAAAAAQGRNVLEYLEVEATKGVASIGEAALLARGAHVLPEFLGNRSPYADPGMRAVIAGLDLNDDAAGLARLYVAGLCGLAYGLADIVDAMRARGIASEMMIISGGVSRSELVRQIMADTTGLRVVLPRTSEPVLLGAAMLGAVAGGGYATLADAMAGMSELGPPTHPTVPAMAVFHAAKRRAHGLMRTLDAETRALMGSFKNGDDGR